MMTIMKSVKNMKTTMTKTTGTPNHGKLDTSSARRIVFTLAVTSSLGFWALFSRLNGATASGTSEVSDTNTTLPPVQVDQQVSFDLPPMPTLIPPIDPSQVTVSAAPLTNQPPVNVAAVPGSGKVFLGGSKPSTAPTTVTRRAPATRTRSSQ
jgi:hypothetical protein